MSYEEVAGDFNGDGTEDMAYIDTETGETWVDLDNNGTDDIYADDSDGDGQIDEVFVDEDGDGDAEQYYADQDGDGTFEYAELDANNDDVLTEDEIYNG